MSTIIEAKSHIPLMNAKVGKNKQITVDFKLDVKDMAQLDQLMNKLRKIRDVYQVKRAEALKGAHEG